MLHKFHELTMGMGIMHPGKNGYGLKDDFNNVIVPPIYDDITDFQNGYAKIKKGNLWGLVNEYGVVIAEPLYLHIDVKKDGTIKVSQKNRQSFLNSRGGLIVPFKYKKITDFHNDTAFACSDSNEWVLIDKTGKELLKLTKEQTKSAEPVCLDDGFILYCYNYICDYDDVQEMVYWVTDLNGEVICYSKDSSSNPPIYQTPQECIADSFMTDVNKIYKVTSLQNVEKVVDITRNKLKETYKTYIQKLSSPQLIQEKLEELKKKLAVLDIAVVNCKKAKESNAQAEELLQAAKDSANAEIDRL